MRNKNYYLIIITVFFLAFFALSINNEREIEERESNLNENIVNKLPREITDPNDITLENPRPKISWAGAMNNITIDDTGGTVGAYTWDQAKDETWCTLTNGIYIIENVTINAGTSPTGSGILINNSNNKNFIIRNCTIYDANIGSAEWPQVDLYDKYVAGIKLVNCSNGVIDNNTCDGGLNACGILVIDGSFNINITDNIAIDNNMHGIMVANYSYNIYIDHNTAHSNYHTYSRGVFIIKGCYNITISNNTMSDNEYNGIFLENNCHDNWILNNICNDTSFGNVQDEGIFLYNGCHNNTIAFNYACDNDIVGIRIFVDCDDNIIKNNTLLEVVGVGVEQNLGIYIYGGSDGNKVINNNVSNSYESGIQLHDNCENNTIAYNIVKECGTDTIHYGIGLYGCSNNDVYNNTANDNHYSGIGIVHVSSNNLIENNTVNYNGLGGIVIAYDSLDNTIENNNCSFNERFGIQLYSNCYGNIISNNILVYNFGYEDKDSGIYISGNCDNNNFTENFISNNGDYGVYISEANCDENLFYNNNFTGNPDNGYDAGTNTKWNNTQIGNYWDDYGGDDDDDDGIGDDDYEVSSGKYDHLPIWWDAPVVAIIFPNLNDIYGNDTIQYSITVSKANINDPEFQMWYILDNGTIRKNATFTELIGYINYFIWNNFSNTFINITFYANDSRGYIGYMNVTVEKNLLIPTISIIKIGFYGVGGISTINFSVALDGPGVEKFWYRIFNGTWSNNYTTSAIVGQLNQQIDSNLWSFLGNGTHTIEFFLNDSVSPVLTQTSINSKFIKDIYPPQIYITSPSNNSVVGISPPDIKFDIAENHLHQIWYSLNDGTLYGNYTYLDEIEDDLDEILYEYWSLTDNGTVIIEFWANDTGGNVNYTIVTLSLRKDIYPPNIHTIVEPDSGDLRENIAPIYEIQFTEPHFDVLWYTLFDGTSLYTSDNTTLLDGPIDQSLWNQLNNGQINITFYVIDQAGNIGYKDVFVIKQAPTGDGALPPADDDDDDDDDDGEDESMDWIIRALIAGMISGSVGITFRIAYSKIKKKREVAREASTPTVVLKKKFEIVHHDFLTPYGKVEQKEFRVGIAQVGLSKTGNLITELFEMTSEGLMRIREDMVEAVSANIKSMIESAHENKINILLFPEMTFDLNYKGMVKEIKKWAQEYNMYIITGGYHDIKTKQNICAVFGPEGIQWNQEKHTPATIHFGKKVFTEAIEIQHPPHKLHICATEYGRIAIAICRDFLDMDLRVEIKNCEPPVDLFFNPAYTPVTVDFEATHFDARRAIYAYTFFANVAEYGGTIINTPEKDRTKRQIPPKEEGLIFKDVDLFSLRSERKKWERRQSKEKRYIQSTRS